ncbi:MAG: TrbI/VirB10 family protein [Sutterella wadsworthensis]
MNRAAGTTVEDYLPAGSFVRGRLLTGVYASTGAGAASQPLPMVIRLEDTAVLPNAWRSQVTACHVTASATGDLSSERAFVRLDRLSCAVKGEALTCASPATPWARRQGGRRGKLRPDRVIIASALPSPALGGANDHRS